MRATRVWIPFLCCVLALAVFAWAQGRKAGLYEVTTDMSWQQSPFPAGMGPGAHGPRTTQVCVTQAQIDKYGDVPPQTRGECQVANMVKKADGYTADVSCSGQMSAKGTVEATYTGDGHGKTKMHMVGAMQMGPNSKPVEYTMTSESTYKGADCGNVKPVGN
jgi:uncharacterized protein DUF3617